LLAPLFTYHNLALTADYDIVSPLSHTLLQASFHHRSTLGFDYWRTTGCTPSQRLGTSESIPARLITPNNSTTMGGFWNDSSRGAQQQAGHRIPRRVAQGTMRVYHSCDPPTVTMLTRYHAGKYTPRTGNGRKYPEKMALVPKRYGKNETVLRCAIDNCRMCELTRDEMTDLSLSVAKDHRDPRCAHPSNAAEQRKGKTSGCVSERCMDAQGHAHRCG